MRLKKMHGKIVIEKAIVLNQDEFEQRNFILITMLRMSTENFVMLILTSNHSSLILSIGC